jgi:hypothetical protein
MLTDVTNVAGLIGMDVIALELVINSSKNDFKNALFGENRVFFVGTYQKMLHFFLFLL